MALNLYTSVGKGLKLKDRMFWGLISTFVKVRGEKMVGWPLPPLILNMSKLNVIFMASGTIT